ncbi:hypothetical protein OK016_24940 [Vibrio chagasii]|nr:hypothetical protein [Vibrio chagasii]
MLNKPVEESSFISVHLGNGASVCAIKDGNSVGYINGLHTTFWPYDGYTLW